jgi:hypothetical protein
MRAPRRVLTFLTSLLAVGMIASAGLAVTKPSMPSPGETATSESDAGTTCVDEGSRAAEPDDSGEDAAGCGDVEGTDEEDEPSPSEEDDSDGVDAPDGETDGDALGEDAGSGAVDPIREAACNEAAGVTPDPEGTEDGMDPAENPVVEKPHGLENAIAHVLENCMYNPQAPGLLVAIRHLVANAANRDMREEAKVDARREEKQPSQRRGPPASHGASGTGGSRGNAGPSGQPSTHGNGNGNAYGHGDSSGSARSSHGNPHGG